ncbi:hypothetical protein [uncultured Arcobacter sp.]|uniref:hypothetical protein n=1 Tax=uncultured Arcobacter sp. TaxID=165434 RepID=UPI00261481A4|nr:hypothetical protein [uncultured Arcobacter sp.]
MTYTTFSGDTPALASEINENLTYFPRYDYIGQDQTLGSTSASTETKIGEVTIPANTVTNGVLVFATGVLRMTGGGIQPNNGTITLRAGASTTITSNTSEKSIQRSFDSVAGINAGWTSGWTIIKYVTSPTWSSTNYIQIGGSNNNGAGTSRVDCESLVVLQF